MTAKRIPLILFILGIIFIGFYGLVLSIIAIAFQIVLIHKNWKQNPALKRPKKFGIGVALYLVGIALFTVGVIQLNSYFGGIGIIMWIGLGVLPFLIGSILLLTLPTFNSTKSLSTTAQK